MRGEARAGCDWRDDDTLTTNVNEASCTIAADLDGVETETEAGVPPEAGVQTACLSAAGPPPPTEATCAAAPLCQMRWDFGTFAGCPEDCGVTDASEDRTLTREVSCRKQAHCHGQPEHNCAGVFAAAGGDESSDCPAECTYVVGGDAAQSLCEEESRNPGETAVPPASLECGVTPACTFSYSTPTFAASVLVTRLQAGNHQALPRDR